MTGVGRALATVLLALIPLQGLCQTAPPRPASPKAPAAPPIASRPPEPSVPLAPPVPDAPTDRPRGRDIGVWTVTCDLFDSDQRDCALTQRFQHTRAELFLAEIDLQPVTPGQVLLRARVPVGARLAEPFVLISRSGGALPLTWVACGPLICEAQRVLPQALLAQMEAAGDLSARFRRDWDGAVHLFPVPLAGAGEGIALLRRARWR
ncbi:invasion associated locus B family protein [Pseudooceanicola nanhaiensis]|uniref:invasion associated locus B family protein n=1 Tax=Pseudooceanicola nanhaiensis TaxID=375761 RepID=UPI001CD75665|nr:invasion associated locus B family protein [Pseudooceanicola nanhaiensis]MCA0922050.1 invasion associated locus B family protein [Pseudooceanicola nanhaiensis]